MRTFKNQTRMALFLFSSFILIGSCHGMVWGAGREDQCDSALKKTFLEDWATITDETQNRLDSTWLSQECEVRAGPEYLIRKYTFHPNGTFLLLRYHYADESCTVPTHTVIARGAIKLLSASTMIPGATKAKYLLHTVHVVPLNRLVAHKLGHKVNVSCSPQSRWRPYSERLIYEEQQRFPNFHWDDGSRLNSLEGHQPTRSHRSVDCLKPLGIDFGELSLVRVQKKPSSSNAFALGSNGRPQVELALASLPTIRNPRISHLPTSLQSTLLLRKDMIIGCPICSAVIRSTESSPPLLHEGVALPALLGGFWLSASCESSPGGMWMKRQLQVFSGDKLWTGQWDYYTDSKCSSYLYSITGAGSYVQRAGRQKRHDEVEKYIEENLLPSESKREFASEPLIFDTEIKRYQDFSRLRKESLNSKYNLDRETMFSGSTLKKSFAAWMTPELVQTVFDMYGPKKMRQEEMLPTSDQTQGEISISNSVYLDRDSIEKEVPVQTENEHKNGKLSTKPDIIKKRRSTEEDSYRHLLKNAQPSMAESFAAMLRGNQRRVETTKKPLITLIPAGTTELDLHLAESMLIPGDAFIATRCGSHLLGSIGYQVGKPLLSWPASCVPHSFEAPSTLRLRARVGVNWSGQYTLKLGSREHHLWEAPLHQCGPTESYNPALRAHLRRSLGLRFGLFSSAGVVFTQSYWFIPCQIFLYFFYRLTHH